MTTARTAGPVRFGVLGCADIAWRNTLPALLAVPGARLVAVASRDAAKAGRFAGRFGCEPVHGYRELLDRTDIDAVYVPLPAMAHADWVERALRAGKHVLAEKPLTHSGRRSAELVALAGERGLVLLDNFMFLHHAQHAAVRELLEKGAIGEPRSFAAAFTIPPKPDGDIRYDPATGGGALLDVGVYPIRAAVHFLGPGLEFAGAVLRRHRDHRVVLSGSVLLTTAEGVTAHLSFGMENAYRNSYEFSGTAGRLTLDRVFTPPPWYQPVVRVERQDHREEFVLPPDHQFVNSVGAFVDAVLRGTDVTPWQQGSLRQAALVDRITAQARVVTVPAEPGADPG
jgi:NDP-hexose-3-ketoreductase